MVFPISFSSFGDIVTAADLALRIAKALSSSTGSSYEYQYLIQELNALAYALQLADTAVHTGMLKRDVVNGLLAEIVRCRGVMDALWERIRGYQKALGSKRGSSSSGSSWRKIGWALFKTQDVQETRMKLTTHRANLITLMTACNLSTLDELRAQSARLERSVNERLNDIYRVLCQIPAKLGYSRANAITLLNWYSTETLLPMDLCETYDQFLMALKAVAQKWPPIARDYAQDSSSFLVCEETKKFTGGGDASFASVFVAGRTIRVTNLSSTTDTYDVSDDWGKVPSWVGYAYCEKCKQGGRSEKYAAFCVFDSGEHSRMVHMGGDPSLATWRATIDEGMHENRCAHLRTLHDPTYAGCPISHLGVPVVPLTSAMGDEDHLDIPGSEGLIRLKRNPAFPYLAAGASC